MPELPDITVYVEALEARVVGQVLERVRIRHPFLLRSADPPVGSADGKQVLGVRRLGKRIVLGLEGDLYVVLHLMIAGRLHWKERAKPIPGKIGLAAFDFSNGTLLLTEASPKKRASLHLVRGSEALRDFERGGLQVLEATLDQFQAALMAESHTLKRALTDPDLFNGVGNAYSDEILFAARLSPVKLTRTLTADEVAQLHAATQATMRTWIDRLRADTGDDFPEKVTAFRKDMAVHGRYRQPCPVCGTAIQRIVHAENEANYCPMCQTGGKLLADRALSRLLKSDWPRSIEELEQRRPRGVVGRLTPKAGA